MSLLPSIEQLNHWCLTHQLQLRFHGVAHYSPRLVNDGFLFLDNRTRELAENIRTTLKADEWHALVDTERGALVDEMHYRVVRYSEMLALRQQGKKPTGLAATLLPYSSSTNSLLLQKRSAASHLFPGYLSLLGGGFNPSIHKLMQTSQLGDEAEVLGDNENPTVTAQREVFEEAGLNIAIPENAMVTITQEIDNGALQINYLGVPADFSGARADENEGLLVEMSVPSLVQVADLKTFTDLAKANLAAWLMVSGT